jgi:glycosyltransferase involved in cell wall biosynthesis
VTLKTTLVFDPDISGHHTEHLNHLYLRAGEKENDNFIFIVHPELLNTDDYMKWPVFRNVTVKFLNYNQLRHIEGNSLKFSYRRSKLLKKIVVGNKVTHVFLDSIMTFLPFLPLILNREVKVSGIVYNIAARTYRKDGYLKRFLDFLKYFIFSNFKVFDRVFLLNDPASARLLNRKFGCHVFHYLPEPVISSSVDNVPNIKKVLKLPEEKKIFLHFGGLAERKGTVDILKSIELLEESLLNQVCFVFAGHINDDIKSVFSELIIKQSKRVQLFVYEGFCKYEFLCDLCLCSDYILLPYKSSSHSSGIFGYAARFNVPVIGNSEGLMGSLIRSFRLGFAYDLHEPHLLAEILKKHILMPSCKIDGSAYLRQNNIANFQRAIFE